jgi:hypothetical protein
MSRGIDPPDSGSSLDEMDWEEISEPGCYVHIGSGLLARVYQQDLRPSRSERAASGRNQVARLSKDPETGLDELRAIAARHRYHVGF